MSFLHPPAGSQLINTHGLKLVLRDVFHSPVRFLHDSLYDEEKDDYCIIIMSFCINMGKGKNFLENYKRQRLLCKKRKSPAV